MPAPPSVPLWQVDAFTERPFHGNPAAVCLLDTAANPEWMQHVAAEMNLAETAFVTPTRIKNTFDLRWFTPTTEVDLCGHATLAAAHVLIEQRQVDECVPIRFQTRSGELKCQPKERKIALDFPSTPANESLDATETQACQSVLGITAIFAARTKFDILLVVEDPQTVRELKPNFVSMADIETRGIIVTACADEEGVDFVSRFFAPRCGINEDPVTGSAHCCLAPYWSARLGRNPLIGYQASSRGGMVHAEIKGDRVQLSGNAVTVMEGKLWTTP
ncbi:PhzF family phenazine biosynthesis protein [Novipirellula sp.]|uniref:PhzF family phenazine biosynthesis protein n=1 Tax=Novipirellula sp. TaxID=2795430 RepID=UPI00356A958A